MVVPDGKGVNAFVLKGIVIAKRSRDFTIFFYQISNTVLY